MPYQDVGVVSRDELRGLQTDRLRETVRHAYENVPFNRERLERAGVGPNGIERQATGKVQRVYDHR